MRWFSFFFLHSWKFQPVPSLDPEVEQKLWDLDYESMELDDFMEEGEKEAFKKQVWDNGWFSVFRSVKIVLFVLFGWCKSTENLRLFRCCSLLFMYYTTKTLDKMEPLTFRGVIKGLRLDNPKSTIYVTLKSCDKAFEKANATQREKAKVQQLFYFSIATFEIISCMRWLRRRPRKLGKR